MSDIDTMTSYVISAGGTPDTNTQTAVAVWDVPATRMNKTKFTIQLDQNAGFWTIYPASTAYPITRGQSSPDLERQLRRFGML
jgi:hypothetical protein